MLRVARFAAYLGFAVAPETEALMRSIVAGGELSTLTAGTDLAGALPRPHDDQTLALLHRAAAVRRAVAAVSRSRCLARSSAAPRRSVLDAGVHRLRALDGVAAAGEPLPSAMRFSPQVLRSAAKAIALSTRLKVPTDCRDLARLTARYAATVRRAAELIRRRRLLDLLLATDALRRPAAALPGLARASVARPRLGGARGGGGHRGGATRGRARRGAWRRCGRPVKVAGEGPSAPHPSGAPAGPARLDAGDAHQAGAAKCDARRAGRHGGGTALRRSAPCRRRSRVASRPGPRRTD